MADIEHMAPGTVRLIVVSRGVLALYKQLTLPSSYYPRPGSGCVDPWDTGPFAPALVAYDRAFKFSRRGQPMHTRLSRYQSHRSLSDGS